MKIAPSLRFGFGMAWVSIIIFSLVSCDFVASEKKPTANLIQVAATQTEFPNPEKKQNADPTAVLIPQSPEGEIVVENTPAVAPDPLVFNFPDAPPEPVSAWRPPLYPVPWAPTSHDHFYFSRPIAADEVNWPLANYRYGGVFFEGVVHTGVDIPASKGTPVIAAGDGKIIWAGYGLYRGVFDDESDPYGKAIVIRHNFGFEGQQLYTVYGHLDRVDVVRGQQIKMGDQLGLVGETGFVTGPHLHLEVRVGNNNFFTTLNPELWLVPPQGWGVAAARIMDSWGRLYNAASVTITSKETGQYWRAIPYSQDGATNSDPFYRENMVISDLPAGLYEVSISYGIRVHTLSIEIIPGNVTYFTFMGKDGFSSGVPDSYTEEFSP